MTRCRTQAKASMQKDEQWPLSRFLVRCYDAILFIARFTMLTCPLAWLARFRSGKLSPQYSLSAVYAHFEGTHAALGLLLQPPDPSLPRISLAPPSATSTMSRMTLQVLWYVFPISRISYCVVSFHSSCTFYYTVLPTSYSIYNLDL